MINFIFKKLDTVDSTNDFLVREVEKGNINKDTILIAKHQTNGHGSNGRTFISDKNVGIYFTLLHFYSDNSELKFITQKAAVAVYTFFKSTFNIELQIKWVNDLYYNGKKVCGILCRNLMKHNAVIIGIGIDLFENIHIQDDIKDIAGYIFKSKKNLIEKLNENPNIDKESCIYKNLYNDFKSIGAIGLDIDDSMMWEPDQIAIGIVSQIYQLIKIEGLPALYVEKNIIKDKRVYEDFNLEC